MLTDKALDDEDDDDEDELDSEEEEEGGRRDKPRKKIKRRAVDAFIDREAEVDDDDEDIDDDEDEQEIAEGFIENEEAGGFSPGAQQDDRRHRELDLQQNRLAEADAEKLAAQYRERYGRSAGTFRGDKNSVPQRLLLPSVDDPSIWGIRCRPGKENEIIFNVLRKQAERESSPAPLQIVSVFVREHLQGYVYIEARKLSHVTEAMTDVINTYLSKTTLVPVAEMPDLLRIRNKGTPLTPGAYVRIRKNNKRYAGDLGRITEIAIDSTEAFVQLVPRIDYSNEEELMKKTLTRTNDRPPARLFNPTDVEKLAPGALSGRRSDSSFRFNGDDYQDGFLIKSFKINHLMTEPEQVQPTLEEMQAFSSADSFDLASLGQGLKARKSTFAIGDTAEVFSGEQNGVYGVVQSITNNVVELKTTDDSGLGMILVPTSGLRKRFSPGNQVRVQSGKHAGETGSVVAVQGDTVILMTNMGKTEVKVFSRDLGEINEVSELPVLSKYDVRDVVELNATEFGCVTQVENTLLNVLLPSGEIKTIKADSVARKILPSKQSRTTDKHGTSIQIAEPQSTVREVAGKGRKGKVFNIHLQTVFCHNIALTEHNGIFVARNRDIEVEGMTRAKVDFSKQNPNMMQPGGSMSAPTLLPKTTGRDKAIGQTIWIRRGPQKGLMGIVTDTTDTTARIEPHNGLKKISVNKDLLGFRTAADQPLIGYADFISSRGWRGSAGMPTREPISSNRPLWAQSGARTPVAGDASSSYGTGSRTPAWAGGGSRTPAWSSGVGSATPAWAGGGSKTPAWAGNATPAWQSGSKTPAWAGSATPSWNNVGSKTPSWQAPKTPAWAANQTPRANTYGQHASTSSYTTTNQSDYGQAGVSRGWEDEWANTGRSNLSAPAHKPAPVPAPPTPASALGDAAFINPARMAQMQHQTPAYADVPGYLPPSP